MPSQIEQYAADNNLDMSVAGRVLAHAIEQKAIKGNKGRPVDLTLEELEIDNLASLVTVADIISAIRKRKDILLAEIFTEETGEEVVFGDDEGYRCPEPCPGKICPGIPLGLKRSRQLIVSSLHNVLKWLGKND